MGIYEGRIYLRRYCKQMLCVVEAKKEDRDANISRDFTL